MTSRLRLVEGDPQRYSAINWTIVYAHTCWFGVGMGQWGCWGRGDLDDPLR